MLCFHAMSIEIVAKSCSSIIMPTWAVLEQLAVLVYFAIGDIYTQWTFTLPCSHHHRCQPCRMSPRTICPRAQCPPRHSAQVQTVPLSAECPPTLVTLCRAHKGAMERTGQFECQAVWKTLMTVCRLINLKSQMRALHWSNNYRAYNSAYYVQL